MITYLHYIFNTTFPTRSASGTSRNLIMSSYILLCSYVPGVSNVDTFQLVYPLLQLWTTILFQLWGIPRPRCILFPVVFYHQLIHAPICTYWASPSNQLLMPLPWYVVSLFVWSHLLGKKSRMFIFVSSFVTAAPSVFEFSWTSCDCIFCHDDMKCVAVFFLLGYVQHTFRFSNIGVSNVVSFTLIWGYWYSYFIPVPGWVPTG